jgi:hypothetical protein
LSGHLIAFEKLVGVGRPTNSEQRKDRYDGQRFHAWKGRFGLWPKMSAIVHFRDDPGKHRDLPAFAIVGQEPTQDRSPQNYAPSRVTATAFDGGTWIGGC